ncbi:unnamed protein product [Lathyrus oleraceus]|uniref:uncharacterized GPI-anchored protein At1g61900 isoform X4 n=1 Tax=Pisum sativum TaxID=3888 RepID=UPI0021D11167|nr:uncharacterized GPI-anchored protein At1g61900-like isoform X4 [Pisum sativum]
MGGYQDANYYRGSWCCRLILFVIWLPTFLHVTAQESHADHRRTTSLVELAKEPTSGDSGLFDPIEISPSVIPKVPFPTESVPPMYPIPYVPTRYEPVLTGGSCPVKNDSTFERTVNTSKLVEACRTVDPLKECCRPVCRPAIMDAALQISGRQMMINNDNMAGEMNHTDYLNDCKGVVYSYLSKQLSSEVANKAFRILSACKVNKVCPLTFKEPSDVIAVCKNVAAPSPTCCSSLNTYIAETQQKILITNKQAIICATQFGSMLRGGGVMTNVYELCDVDLKDFSIQALLAFGVQDAGCLLRSLPGDVIFDNSSGVSFTCDLSDNIAAPWPSSSSFTSLSFCAPEMSLPALPISQSLKNIGCNSAGVGFLVIFTFFVSIVVLRF